MDALPVMSPSAGGATIVSTSAAAAVGTIDCTGCDKIYVAHTSATLSAWVGIGSSAVTADTTMTLVPPMSQVILAANDKITNVGTLGTAAGPFTVSFMPLRRGN